MLITVQPRTLNNPDLGPDPAPRPDAAAKPPSLIRPAWLPTYIPELEGLRGVAVLAVVLYHCHERLTGTWIYHASLWGWAGVNLFFALSGFLITSILLESRGKPHYFRNFYARRILRIWPVYFLLLAICYAVPEWFLGDSLAHQSNWKILASYALFVQNLRHFPLPGPLGPTWSLAIEEQYYFVWAPIVLLFGAFSPNRLKNWILPTMLVAMIATSPIFRLSHAHFLNTTHTLIHLEAIAMGSLLALGLHRWPISRNAWLTIGLCSAVIGFALAATIAGGTAFLDTGLAMGFTGVVISVIAATGSGNPISIVLRRGPLPFYGKISYGLYMTHILVFVYFGNFDARLDDTYRLGVPGNLMIIGLRLIASTAVATVLWYGFESQILKLKRFF